MLFGHQDNSKLAAAGTNTDGVLAGGPPALDPSGTAGLPSIPDNFEPETGAADQQASALNQNVLPTQTISPTPTPSEPVRNDTDTEPHPAINTIVPSAQTTPPPIPASLPEAPVVRPNLTAETPASDEPKVFDPTLLNLKQQALAQLEPLVGHLDQTPEEKFRTTMMLIQSADNQALIQTAYEAAQAIPDEKVKAQALLDVVNEINYFAQKSKAN